MYKSPGAKKVWHMSVLKRFGGFGGFGYIILGKPVPVKRGLKRSDAGRNGFIQGFFN